MLSGTSVFPHTGVEKNVTRRVETCCVIKLPLGNDDFTAEGSRVEKLKMHSNLPISSASGACECTADASNHATCY